MAAVVAIDTATIALASVAAVGKPHFASEGSGMQIEGSRRRSGHIGGRQTAGSCRHGSKLLLQTVIFSLRSSELLLEGSNLRQHSLRAVASSLVVGRERQLAPRLPLLPLR